MLEKCRVMDATGSLWESKMIPLLESMEYKNLGRMGQRDMLKAVKSMLRRQRSSVLVYRWPWGYISFFRIKDSDGTGATTVIASGFGGSLSRSIKRLKSRVDACEPRHDGRLAEAFHTFHVSFQNHR